MVFLKPLLSRSCSESRWSTANSDSLYSPFLKWNHKFKGWASSLLRKQKEREKKEPCRSADEIQHLIGFMSPRFRRIIFGAVKAAIPQPALCLSHRPKGKGIHPTRENLFVVKDYEKYLGWTCTNFSSGGEIVYTFTMRSASERNTNCIKTNRQHVYVL